MQIQYFKKTLIIFGILVILIIIGSAVFAKKNNTITSENIPTPQDQIKTVDEVVQNPLPITDQKNIHQTVTILTYHSVEPKTDKKEGVMQKHYHIYPENFEAQMQYLKDNGYHPITLKQLTNTYRGVGELPEKAVVLTFDDGWKNQYTYAFPILKKFGYSATFFIITKTRGGSYMTWDEIHEMDLAGMDIQSHSETHQKLSKISADKARQEVVGSKKTLETELGHGIESIAYPYYDHNDVVMKMVEDAGYVAARAGWSNAKNGMGNIFSLNSQEVVNNKNPFSSTLNK